jgi:hypothetical protein
MPNFLFWNLNRKNLTAPLAGLVADHSVDIVLLAECTIPAEDIVLALNSTNPDLANFYFAETPDDSRRILVFVKYDTSYIQPLYDGKHLTIRRVQFPTSSELLLAGVHLPSLYAAHPSDLDARAAEVADEILESERIAGHSRTIVVGDFNMNPFSQGMISAAAFNAVAQKKIAQKGSRILHGKTRQYFYNPMWRFFSEKDGEPSGTYYYTPTGYDSLYWHLFDQVIIRPELISKFNTESVRIVSRCPGHNLMDCSFDKPEISDHLPIIFSLTN